MRGKNIKPQAKKKKKLAREEVFTIIVQCKTVSMNFSESAYLLSTESIDFFPTEI